MVSWKRLLSAVGARRVIGVLGSSYLVLAGGRAVVLLARGVPLGNLLIVSSLIAAPGLGLLYGGYALARSEIDPEFYPDVAAWTLAGFGAMGAILLVYHLQPEGGISSPGTSPPILTALSSVAGLAVGTNAAEARSRTRELERRNRELRETQAELEETVAKLERSNERLEQFAYAASHDLQEPMRMVSSYLTLIERRYEDELDDDLQEYLEFAVGGADRMRAMIDGLLQYSRVQTEGDPLEPVDLDAVVDDVLDDLGVKIRESDATITRDSLPRVEGDPDQLRQVFQNLLDNAITYSGEEPPEVDVTAERSGSEWTISVRDEGIGIDSEDQDRIFEVFERVQSRSEYGGSGIGLALCQRIVERHGGEIGVESDPGDGTEFYFTLSAVDDGNEQSAGGQQGGHPPRRRQPR